MKKQFVYRSFTILLILIVAFLMTQCEQVNAPAEQTRTSGTVPSLQKLGTLDDQEIADILFIREEEKLARDVYRLLYAQWGLQIHARIAVSEQSHMDAMGDLIVKYGLTDPVTDDTPGVFTNPDIKALFDDLMELGMVSKKNSLEAGVIIEETDITDIQAAMDQVEGNPDIVKVYENLLAGSENHLDMFLSHLE